MNPEEYIVKMEEGEERTVTAKSHDVAGGHDFVSFYNKPEGGEVVYLVERYRVQEIIPVEGGSSNVEEARV